MYKTCQFKLSVKNDNYDTCKTENIKLQGQVGFTVLRRLRSCAFVNESSRSYMLAFRIYVISCRSKSPMDYLD
jgi:hypothetical protein